MRDFTSATIRTVKPSGIRKFFDIASTMEDCVSLGVGEPDFDTPWHISVKGMEAISSGKTFYTANNGLKELRQEIADWNKRKYGLDYTADEVLVTVGGSEGIYCALASCIEPGDEVLILAPNYVCYEPDVLLSGGKPVIVNLSAKNEFRLTPEELRAAITPKTKILLMNYPNNPTGAIMRREDLEAIAPIIIEHDLMVVSDEIYSELTYGSEHAAIAALPGMKERTVTINGFSKTYSMTGWRLGYALAPKAIMDQMKKVHQFLVMSAPTPSQIAGIEAIRNGEEDIRRMREEYDVRRHYLLNEYKRIGLPCFEAKGAFYLFPCITSSGLSSDEFAMQLLKEYRVVVVPGTAFGECGEGFIRTSYAYSLEDLKKAIGRIEKFLESLR